MMPRRGRIKYSGAYSRFRDRLDSEDDDIEIDEQKPLGESILDSLREIIDLTGQIRKGRKLAQLSALIKLWSKKEADHDESCPSLKEVLFCLRVSLCQDSLEVRAATLRALRYLINTERDVELLTSVNLHYLVARCLDIELDNKVERVQALRLIRKLTFVGASHFPLLLCRSLVAIAEGGKQISDRLHRACLGCLCELSLLNCDVFVRGQGVNALIFCLLDTSMPRVTEAVLACLLRLSNDPRTRTLSQIDLGIAVAPFTEFRYIHQDITAKPSVDMATVDDKSRRFQIASNVILSLMRSWPGILLLCKPNPQGGSHLQALVSILYLKNADVRKLIVLLFFELLNVKPPKETKSFEVALTSVDPSTFRESWKLADGFVVSEGLDILPHLAKSRPNLIENHKSLLLSCLIQTCLPEALVEVIISSSAELSILTTIFLAEFLHLASLLLPRELNLTSHCLPALLAEISNKDPVRSNRASEAVIALQKIHTLKKRGPIAASVFLDQILKSSGHFVGEGFVGDRLLSPNWTSTSKRSTSEQVRINVKLSKVNDSIDSKSWDWSLISSILKWPSENFHNLENSDHRQFVKRVSDFFKPSNNLFSKLDVSSTKAKKFTKIGFHLIDFLISGTSVETQIILDDFLLDIRSCFDALTKSKSPNDCLLSPSRIATTASQFYFAFIGRLSYSADGRKALDKHRFLACMADLIPLGSDLYMKLVISCLDYSPLDWGSRNLLSKALKEGTDPSKLFSTKFLGVLVRSRVPNIAQWGIELLVGQLFDSCPRVTWVALDLLEEACDDKMNLEAVVCALGENTDLDHLGIRGAFLRNRFYCSSNGQKLLTKQDASGRTVLNLELERWSTEWNLSYVIFVEELLNDGLSRHQRNEDRCYGRRSHEAHALRDAFLPTHLYGQLAQSKFGFEALIRDDAVKKSVQCICDVTECPPSCDWPEIKSSIWACANIALSPDGANFIQREGALAAIVDIAESNQVHSLRGSAFYALGLVATNRQGCDILANYGWSGLRYGRDEKWPVLEDWFNKITLLSKQLDSDLSVSDPDFQLSLDESSLHQESECKAGTPETPPEYYLQVSSTESSPRTGVSLSARSRFGAMFRSFNLGSSTGSGSKQHRRSSSDAAKVFAEKIKKNLFPRSRTHSHSSTGEKDEPSPTKSIPSLKTVEEGTALCEHVNLTEENEPVEAPIAVAESLADSSNEELDSKVRSVEEEHQHDRTPTSPFAPFQVVLKNSSSSPEETGDLDDTHGTVFEVKAVVETTVTEEDDDVRVKSKFTKSLGVVNLQSVAEGDSAMIVRNINGETRKSPSKNLSLDLSKIESSSVVAPKLSPIASSPAEADFPKQSFEPDLMTKEQIIQQAKSRLHTRSGTRALSESEAQNLSVTSRSSWKKPGDPARVSASQNTWSITSISSVGSWTETPGYLAFRTIHNKRRPPLSESESDATGAGALLGREVHGELPGAAGVLRSDSWTKKSRSLDYRLIKLRHRQRPSEFDRSDNRAYSAPPARPAAAGIKDVVPIHRGPEQKYWGVAVPRCVDQLFGKLSDIRGVENEPAVTEYSSRPVPEAALLGLELHTKSSCLACVTLSDEVSSEGGESVVSSGRKGIVQHRREILRFISAMNASVGAKTAEQGLLKYKQQYLDAFNDLCLYSEVCLLMTEYSFRISSRRFIQELFMDLQYDLLCSEPFKILGMRQTGSSRTSSGDDVPASSRCLTQVTEALVEDPFSSLASSPFA